jgi:hypothetical protein
VAGPAWVLAVDEPDGRAVHVMGWGSGRVSPATSAAPSLVRQSKKNGTSRQCPASRRVGDAQAKRYSQVGAPVLARACAIRQVGARQSLSLITRAATATVLSGEPALASSVSGKPRLCRAAASSGPARRSS